MALDSGTEKTLIDLAQAMSKLGIGPSELAKAFSVAGIPTPGSAISGLVYYDLEAPSKKLFPVITPLRNKIPRVKGNGGVATNWRAVTGINVQGMPLGVSEGNRGSIVQTAVQDYTAKYVGLGLEDFVTFEADLASQNFEDLKSLSVENLLKAVYIQEEQVDLAGNASFALGVTPTPTVSTTAGASTFVAATAYVVRCVALTQQAFVRALVPTATVPGGVPGTLTRTNADGSQDVFGGGSAGISAASSTVTPGVGNFVVATVTPVVGAVAYAWFVGQSANDPGGTALAAITTVNGVQLTGPPPGVQSVVTGWNAASKFIGQIPAALIPGQTGGLTTVIAGYGVNAVDFTAQSVQDNSRNTLVYDGLITQVANPANNAVTLTLATNGATGTGLSVSTGGGIPEIDTVLQAMWDKYRLGPTEIHVASQELGNITKKILTSGATAPLFRFNLDATQRPGMQIDNLTVAGGAVIGTYLNKFSMAGGNLIPVRLHPFMPAGTILFYTDVLPYPLSNVQNVLQIKTRREYYQLEWPLRTRRYEYGVYVDQVLQNFAPFAFAGIFNIGNL